MTNTSVYTPSRDGNGGVKHNRQFKGFGQVNVATDTSVDLKFRFVDAPRKSPQSVGSLCLHCGGYGWRCCKESSESVTM